MREVLHLAKTLKQRVNRQLDLAWLPPILGKAAATHPTRIVQPVDLLQPVCAPLM